MARWENQEGMFSFTHIFHEVGWIHLFGQCQEEVFEVAIGLGQPTFLCVNPTYETGESLHTGTQVFLRMQPAFSSEEQEVLDTYSRFCVDMEDEDAEERLEEVGISDVLVTLLGGMLCGLSIPKS
jgi:hypothetical protein